MHAAKATREAHEHEDKLLRQQLSHHRISRKGHKRLACIYKAGARLITLLSRLHDTPKAKVEYSAEDLTSWPLKYSGATSSSGMPTQQAKYI